jgi:hypothetical protein
MTFLAIVSFRDNPLMPKSSRYVLDITFTNLSGGIVRRKDARGSSSVMTRNAPLRAP